MNRSLVPLLALGLVLLAAGCGGGGGDSPAAEESPPPATAAGGGGDGGTTLEVPADPEKLAFDVSELEAPAGPVTLVMGNPSTLPHNVAIKGNGIDVKGEVVSGGGTSTVTPTSLRGRTPSTAPSPVTRREG